MHIVFVAAEAHPFVKTGGLGDVVGSLPAKLCDLGHRVSLFLPAHHAVRRHFARYWVRSPLEVPGPTGIIHAELVQIPSDDTGVAVYFIDEPGRFDRGGPYVDDTGKDYPDNNERFAFFCRAVLVAATELPSPIDCFHLHDWQTGLIPVYLKSIFADRFPNSRTLFTIHNLAFQGNFPFADFEQTMLPDHLRGIDGLEFFGRFSHLKGGLLFADRLSTVSPNYAREIQTEEFGCGMQGILRWRQAVLAGITNGIDLNIWNPAADAFLDSHYSCKDWRTGKSAAKLQLAKFAKFEKNDLPLIAMVGRLSPQKGFDIFAEAVTSTIERPANVIALATPASYELELPLWNLVHKYPGRANVFFDFNETLSHLLFAAADITIVPSRFEPCGLTQLFAQRYGSVPVVAGVGGLLDTVVDANPVTLATGTATGFVYKHPTPTALRTALARALLTMDNPETWARLVHAGMNADFSWESAAKKYAHIYQSMR